MLGLGNHFNRCVQHFSLPAWISGYRYMKCVSSEQMFEVMKINVSKRVVKNPLPRNIFSRDQLDKKILPSFSYSFYDVPELCIEAGYLLNLTDVSLLYCRDQWNDDFYALVTSDGRSVIPPGIGYKPMHRMALRGECLNLDEAVWFGGMWLNNFYLWHTTYLCRLMRIIELGLHDRIILPARSLLKNFVIETLDYLGIKPIAEIGLETHACFVKKLQVVIENPYGGELLRAYRDQRVDQQLNEKVGRRIYVSRRKANYRHIVNEDNVIDLFKGYGWEIHCMEDYSYSSQIELMKQSSAIAGLHGAGFANMLFMPKKSHIFEISVRERPNPNFYALASALNHNYWLSLAQTERLKEVLYDNAIVDEKEVENILQQMK